MPQSEERALEIIQGIAAEIDITRTIEGVTYRSDWQDFQVILDETFHCEIREKLIDMLAEDIVEGKEDTLRADARREVEFRLNNLVEFEDWE